jgi:hypothetical protein
MAEIYSVRLELRELELLVAELTHVVPNPSQSDLPEIWHTFVCKKDACKRESMSNQNSFSC